MSITVERKYLPYLEYIQPIGKITKVEIKALGHVIVNGWSLDLRGAQETTSIVVTSRELGLDETGGGIVTLKGTEGVYVLTIVETVVVPEGETAPADTSKTHATAPTTDEEKYPVWPGDERPGTAQTISRQHPDNIPELSYARKQAIAVKEIEKWREQLKVWMIEAASLAHAGPDVIQRVGAYLRAADASLQEEFRNPDTDPLVVAKMAKEASSGPLGPEDTQEFIETINIQHTRPPRTGSLWVTKGSGKVSEVRRVNFDSPIEYRRVDPAEATYNSLDKRWIKENQEGTITLRPNTATIGTAITATITDPDGGVARPIWKWETKASGGEWTAVTGATSATYTPVSADDGKQLRATVAYTDRFGPGNIVISEELTVS